MTAYERLLDRLRADGRIVKESRPGRAMAQCPAHEDGRPSLSLTRIEGSLLLYCFAGCHNEDVLAALQLTKRDLYDSPAGARYRYTDPAGQVLRTVTRTPDKRFRQSGQTRGTSTLYRLPEVVAAVAAGRTVWLVEGEKDVHALESLGAVATTAPMGATNWDKVDPSPLHGARVVVVPDADPVGEKWAADVAASLAGVAAGVEWCRGKVGKDAADHVGAGYGLGELESRDPPEAAEGAQEGAETRRRVLLTPASQIAPRRVRWLWEDRLALGTLGLLAGREGVGKSTLAYWIASQITLGALPGEYYGQPRGTLVCATEDSWAHTIVPRLIAAGADLDRVYRVEVEAAGVHVGLSLPRDLAEVEDAAAATDAALLVLDPLISRLDSSLDTHRDAEVRIALEPLTRLADRAGLSVAGLIHLNKTATTDPLTAVMGSRAFTAVARSVHSVVVDPDDDTNRRRLFGTPKNNLGRTDLPTLTYAVEGYAVPTDDGDAWTGRVVWGEDTAVTISDAMRAGTRSADEREDRDEAAEWLAEHLQAQGGAAESAAVKRAARAAGIADKALRRARERLRLLVESSGYPRVTTWTLPGTVPDSRALSRDRIPRGEDLTDSTTTTEGFPPSGVSCVSRAPVSSAGTTAGTTGVSTHPAPRSGSDNAPDCLCGTPLTGPVQLEHGQCNRCFTRDLARRRSA